jgi:hypothetical protein
VNGSSSYSANSTRTDSGGSLTPNAFKIGRHSYDDNENANIDISEFIFFSGAIKKRDRWEIENYLGKKYNISVIH